MSHFQTSCPENVCSSIENGKEKLSIKKKMKKDR